MSIYKVITWKEAYDPESDSFYWKRASEWTKKDEENWVEAPLPWQEIDMGPEEKKTLEEAYPLYKDSKTIAQIKKRAQKLDFEFRLEKGSQPEEKPP